MQRALGHGGEGLADEQLGERGLRAPHHRRQDVDGRLRAGGGGSARPRAGRGAHTPVPTARAHAATQRALADEGEFLEKENEREADRALRLLTAAPHSTGQGGRCVSGHGTAGRHAPWRGALGCSAQLTEAPPRQAHVLKAARATHGPGGGPEPRAGGEGGRTAERGAAPPLTAHSPAGSLSAGACMMLTRVGISLICIGPWQASIWDSSLKMS